MSTERGKHAEQRACDYLQAQGLQLLQRNYRSKRGEIDLIMQDTDKLVFVEVRYRRQSQFGSAAESVDWRKQAKLVACAQHYILTHPQRQQQACRFDVVALSGPGPTLEWIPNAFAAG